jgi:predicted permease
MWRDLIMRMRSLLRRDTVERELDDELRFHYERQIEQFVSRGMTRNEAERRTRIVFGGLEQVREECRNARGTVWLEHRIQDSRYAWRTFCRSPGFTAIAVITLALGIGATTTIFALVDSILLRPLPYPHADQLVGVEVTPLALDPNLRGMAPEDYFVFREQGHAFQDVGIYLETDSDGDVNVTGAGDPERVHAIHVTDGVLSVLGIPAARGRIFSPVDDAPDAPPTVVITDEYWRQKFSADPSVVGRTLVVDGRAREIIGIMPAGFRFLDQQDLAVILPLQLDRNQVRLGNFIYFGIARLKGGETIASGSADVARLLPATLTAFPAGPAVSLELLRSAQLVPSLLPLKQELVGNIGTLLWLLMGGVATVLLVACANVANLLLMRTEARQHELVVRAALGASRRRIGAQVMWEGVLLALSGAAVGLAVTWLAVDVLIALAPAGLPRVGEIGLYRTSFVFALTVALSSSVVFGMVPAVRHAGASRVLPSTGRTLTRREGRLRMQDLLVAGQVAFALVLLVGAGLMIRTLSGLTHADPGFARPGELQTFRISISVAEVPDDEDVARVEQQIQDRLAAIAGVSSVGFSSAVPMDGDNRLDNVFAADHVESGAAPPLRHLVFMSPGYLQTLGTPLLAGREFRWAEIHDHVPVALISENFARQYWGDPNRALGKRLRVSGADDWREIVGVVRDVHDEGVDKPARSTVYWPTLLSGFRGKPQRVDRYPTFVVRSSVAGSQGLMKEVRKAVWSIDGRLPFTRIHTLEELYARSTARTSLALTTLSVAASMALLLGMMGLYGAVAYAVSQRTREIGIRMALGARPQTILLRIIGRGMTTVAVGLGAGLVAAGLLTRALSFMLFGVEPQDPLTYATVAGLLALTALLACAVPARRASRLQPTIALRDE